jgi:hypothetical protein
MIIEREMIESRLKALHGQHDKLLNDLQATWGAIQESELWLKVLSEEKPNVSNSIGSGADDSAPRPAPDSNNNPDNG